MAKKRPYLAFDLDALENCGPIGASCGLRPEQVSHGLLLLWRHVWRAGNPIVTTGHLIGFFFGANPCEALLTFGHLEATESGWRVKGAAEYLRVVRAQSESGKRHSSNLRKGKVQNVESGPTQAENSPALVENPPAPLRLSDENGDESRENSPATPPALTASSQQPTAGVFKAYVEIKPADLAEVWNDYRPVECPTVRADSLSSARTKAARARLRERPSLDDWVRTVVRLRDSDFCRGLTGRGGWVATFDWLLRPDTATKIDEGSYDGGRGFDPNQGIMTR